MTTNTFKKPQTQLGMHSGGVSAVTRPSFGNPRKSNLLVQCLACLVAVIALISTFAAQAADYVLVVDTSGSMTGHVSTRDKRVRIAVVQDALKNYLPALPTGARVYLIAFNSGIVSQKEVILRDAGHLAEADAWVRGLAEEARKNRETHLWTTLRHALEKASAYSRDNPEQAVTVRVLTDGQDTEHVTTFDTVIQAFPLVDGQHIRGNLVLLGDIELKTKLVLPEGAFDRTKNTDWEDLFPPVVMWAPTEPEVGQTVRMFENTRSIYAEYEWRIEGVVVGREKVLSWRFTDARAHRVSLQVKGLRGTPNAATVMVKAREKPAFTVDLVCSHTNAQPGQEVKFIARSSVPASNLVWYVNSKKAATGEVLTCKFVQEGNPEVKLEGWDAEGRVATRSHSLIVKEAPTSVWIVGPTEVVAGKGVQFACDASGPCERFEWRFGDGGTSTERNPFHTYVLAKAEDQEFSVTLRATSPSGHVADAPPLPVRVRPPPKIKAPVAAFRVLEQQPRVGDAMHLISECDGLVESWEWRVNGEGTNTNRSPVVRLTSAGEKGIILKVKGPGGVSEAQQKVIVSPRYREVKAKMAVSRKSGTAPMTVKCLNQSQGDYKAQRWNFGDGQTSDEPNPQHTFATPTKCAIVLTVYPANPSQVPVEDRLQISVGKPSPTWARLLPFVGCLLTACTAAALLARQRRRRTLRLPVHFWPQTSPICRTILLTDSDEIRDLGREVSIRIKRIGKTSGLVVEPRGDAQLLRPDGQPVGHQPIGDGAVVVVKDGAKPEIAVAISAREKPRRPTKAGNNAQPNPFESEPTPHAREEFDWGWETAATNKK